MDTILDKAEKYVVNYLNENLNPTFIYHNLSHTQRVVEKTKELIDTNKDIITDAESIILAAWFHDIGYTKSHENHEEKSVEIAYSFLNDSNIDEQQIETISSLILATKKDYLPKNINEKIIRDADCAHLGSKNFFEYTELLRKELEIINNKSITEIEWINENVDFLTFKHRFYTDYASANWDSQKSKNLAQLLKRQKKTALESTKLKHKKEELRFKKHKKELPERGIETMFRVALRNHITLSDIADTKANILLSVNAIIISLALSNLIPKLDNPSNHYLIIPTLIFIIATVASIVLSVMATRPNVTSGKFTKEDVANKKVNLLFFGNFHKMNLDEFEWAMGEMMQDRDYLYGSLTKDLYFLGLVLNRKYSLLRLTYTVFMIGIIVSVLAFAVSFKLYGS